MKIEYLVQKLDLTRPESECWLTVSVNEQSLDAENILNHYLNEHPDQTYRVVLRTAMESVVWPKADAIREIMS